MTKTLRALEGIQSEFGAEAAATKRTYLAELARTKLASAGAVLRLHECLGFLRAYPDDPALLAEVERQLAGFARRADLRRFAGELADSGIAGTAMHYQFFAEMAKWLVQRFAQHMRVDWQEFEHEQALESLLPLLVTYGESPALDELTYPMRDWCERLKGKGETDAAFLVRRFAALQVGPYVHEWLYQSVQLPLVLKPGEGTPSRTLAAWKPSEVVFQTRPLDRARPDLGRAARQAPLAVRELSRREGRRMVDLAREAMLTRSRDLDVFSYGNPDDVRLIECGDGLAFAAIGLLPERRLLLEAVYGFLTLKNGVPIGYVLNSALFGSAEIAYNVFETFRGGEAAHVYGRVLATLRHLFGCDSFTIYPYQLGGDGNEEGLASGAWWFYQKLGFRARDPGVLRLMSRELARQKRSPGARTSIATLRKLAAENVYLHLGRQRDDVIGILPLADVGLAVADALALRCGSGRERGQAECAREAARLLGLRSQAGWTRTEMLAWLRWAPLVVILPGLERWPQAARRDLIAVVRAKGGRRESDFVRLFDSHRLLRRALVRLSASVDDGA